MSENREITEEPTTHKKKAQIFLFLLLGVLVFAMIASILKDIRGRDDRAGAPEERPAVAAVDLKAVDIQTFESRMSQAERQQTITEKKAVQVEREEAQQLADQARDNREAGSRGWHNTMKSEKTPAQIFAEDEQLRALQSRRAPLIVRLDSEQYRQAAVMPQEQPRNIDAEQQRVRQEIERMKLLQQQVAAGQIPQGEAVKALQSSMMPGAGNLPPATVAGSGGVLTAQTAADYEVGQPVQEQVGGPRPGQVLLPTGQVLSAALDQMVMSDFTGPFRAILTQDVYDVTGRFVLFPKGAKIIGQTVRVRGINEPIQNRMILTVNWLVLPNGKRVNFNKTVSMDSQGVAALKDQVNYHLIPQVLGVAAYALLSSETSRSGSGSNNDSTYAGEVGASMRDQFAPLASRYLTLVPTVTLRQGTPMRIFIEDDIYVIPWDRAYSGVLPRG